MKRIIFVLLPLFSSMICFANLQRNGFATTYQYIDNQYTENENVLWTADGFAYKKNGIHFYLQENFSHYKKQIFTSIWSKSFEPNRIYVPVIIKEKINNIVVKVYKVSIDETKKLFIEEADGQDVIVYIWALNTEEQSQDSMQGFITRFVPTHSGGLFYDHMYWLLHTFKLQSSPVNFDYSSMYFSNTPSVFHSIISDNDSHLTIPYISSYTRNNVFIDVFSTKIPHDKKNNEIDHHQKPDAYTLNTWALGIQDESFRNQIYTQKRSRAFIMDEDSYQEYKEAYWISDILAYKHGGIALHYPKNFFSERPHLCVSASPFSSANHEIDSQAKQFFLPEITTNKATECTLRIHRITIYNDEIVEITEADDNQALAHIWLVSENR